jgi:hypothetical protein
MVHATGSNGGPEDHFRERNRRMDSQKFDSLVKSLSSGSSRRRVLKGLAATAFGGLIVATGAKGVAAAPPCKSAASCDPCSTDARPCWIATCTASTGNAKRCGCAPPPDCRNDNQSRSLANGCKCTGSA